MDRPRPSRLRRWLLFRVPVGLVLLGLLVAGLPWLASLGPVRALVLQQVNQKFAPTVIEVESVSASWLAPIRMTGVVLRDREGKAVVQAPRARLDQGLAGLLWNMPDYGSLILEHAEVDIQRHDDGRIDLWDALGPLLASDPNKPGNPATDFTLVIEDGSLILVSPELAEPIVAARLDLTLHAAPAPGPLSWDIQLTGAGETMPEDHEPETLHVTGTLDHRKDESPVALKIDAERWPVALASAGVHLAGGLDGSIAVDLAGDRLHVRSESKLLDARAGGPTLSGDTPRLGDVRVRLDATQDAGRLAVETLDLDSVIAHLELKSEAVGSAPSIAEGWVDLPELARRLPNTIRLRQGLQVDRGSVRFEGRFSTEAQGGRLELKAHLLDLSAHDANRTYTLTDPVQVRAQVVRSSTGPVVEDAVIETPFLQAKGQGDLEKGIVWSGSADLEQLQARLSQWVDLGALRLAGRARFGGDLKRDSQAERPGFVTRLAVEATNLSVAGVTPDPIQRPKLRADAVAWGPLDESSTPVGWSQVRVKLESGALAGQLNATRSGDSIALNGSASALLADVYTLMGSPAPPPEQRNVPIDLALDGRYTQTVETLELSRVRLETSYGQIDAKGSLSELSSRLVANLEGIILPNYPALQQELSTMVGSAAGLQGEPGAFRIRGPLMGGEANEILRGLDAQLGLKLTGASMAGLEFGAVDLRFQSRSGQVAIAPITTSLNGGQVKLHPGVLIQTNGDVLLLLGDGTAVEKAQINPALSRQLLSYVAPVLHEATQVSGHVSARIEHATIPVLGASGLTSTDLVGQILFHDVTYGPGPMTQQIFVLARMPNYPSLTINQTVDVAISKGRVIQRGLAIQATPDVQFQLDGSVGLDSTLALKAGVPLTPAMLGGQDFLNDVASGTRVGVPIGGTLSRPTIDRSAFQVGLRDTARSLIGRAADRGAAELLKKVIGDEPLPAEASPAQAPRSVEGALEGLGRGLIRQILPGEAPPAAAPGPRPR